MNLKNEIMLITYADSMGKNLKELHELLNQYYQDAVGGVHILPFSRLLRTEVLLRCVTTRLTRNSATFQM